MELLTASKSSKKNPIPMMSVESSEDLLRESWTECSDNKYYRTAECAYYKAEARGFEPGHEVEDWLAAEAEVLQ